MEIRRLPEDVASVVKSGAVISDATQCVLELVFNSLDAKATSIAVRVNLQNFYVQVVDNGLGVATRDITRLGMRHMTNKCRDLEELEGIVETFGYRGASLASIKDVSEKIEVQTLHHLEKSTYTLEVNRNGDERLFENKSKRPVHGTTVTVTDLMCSLPVRRKRIKEVFDLDDIVHQIEALAVIHYQVSFSVRNDSVGKVLLQTHRYEDPRESLTEFFGFSPSKQLIPIANGRGNIRVSGFISKQLHDNTNIQLVYINRRIVDKSKIHKLVLSVMKKYGGFWDKDRNESDEAVDVEGYVFIVKIDCPYPSYTLSRNGKKASVEFRNTEEVLKCVHRAVAQSLKDGSLESSLEDGSQIPEEKNKPKGRGFGPSQLQNAVQGRRVIRNSENPETKNPNEVVPSEEFFCEISGDGTALAENAPVYEIPDFARFSFHGFLAWLQSQSFKDEKAAKFLSEFAGSKPVSRMTAVQAPLVSLKEIRKEKLENRSKMMLKKLEESHQLSKRLVGEGAVGLARKIIHRETTTYTRTPTWPSITASVKHLPQVSFGEFLAWMKYKAKHDVTANQMMNQYFSIKRQAEKTDQLWKGSQTKKSKISYEFKTPNCDQSLKQLKPNSSKGIQCTIEKKAYTVETQATPLCTTWKSHYRSSPGSVRLAESGMAQLTPIAFPEISEELRENRRLFRTPVSALQLMDCSVEEMENIPPSPVLIVCHQEVQACPLVKPAATQTTTKPPKRLVSTCVQTDEVKIPEVSVADNVPVSSLQREPKPLKRLISTCVQTDEFKTPEIPNIPKEHSNTADAVPLSSQQREPNLQLISTSVQTHEFKTPEIPNIPKDSNTADAVSTPKRNPKQPFRLIITSGQSDELKTPEIPIIPKESSNLADTVPVSTQQPAPLQDYFSHGYSDFQPPTTSTRKTDDSVDSSAVPALRKSQIEELKVVLADSCEDYVASVKWTGCSEDLFEKELSELHREVGVVMVSKNEATLSSVAFTKDNLETARVIGQVDRKFLAVLISKQNNGELCKLVCLIDQHAAHERITLEMLLQQYQNTGKIESRELDRAFPLTVSKSTLEIFKNEKTHFLNNGILAGTLGTTALLIRAVPACFLRRQQRELKSQRQSSLKRMVADLVEEIVHHLTVTRGAAITLPKAIMSVIASEACRASIKFNQTLGYEEMVNILNQLKKCQLPFQCAHGRPSIAPIFEMENPGQPCIPQRHDFQKFKKK